MGGTCLPGPDRPQGIAFGRDGEDNLSEVLCQEEGPGR